MKIKRLKIEGLFERNYDIDFYEDITLLYGVNGCGKTTILNILSTIISGDLYNLKRYDFKSLELFISGLDKSEDRLFIKESIHSIPMYQVYFKGKMALIPKEVKEVEFDFDDGSYKKNNVLQSKKYPEREDFLEGKEDYSDKSYNELVYEIQEAFYQLYIPLTRKSVSIDQLQGRNIRVGMKGLAGYSDANTYLDNSVKKAVTLLRDYMMAITMRENRTLESLKGKILKLALSSSEVEIDNLDLKDLFYLNSDLSEIPSISNFNIPIEQNLSALKEKLESCRGAFEIEENNSIKIIDPMGFANFVAAMSQLKKFAQIAEVIHKANRSRETSLLPVNKLIATINEFLEDGEKEILLDSRGILKFKRIGSSKQRSISVMSSGEKQIVIFFVYIILGLVNEKRKGIFIIDEPELSLHVEWQNKFIPNLLEVAGDTQLILATHSPEIIGDRTEKCVEVRGVL
ncbi:AAA family ATPase [Bacillus toyonensis]